MLPVKRNQFEPSFSEVFKQIFKYQSFNGFREVLKMEGSAGPAWFDPSEIYLQNLPKGIFYGKIIPVYSLQLNILCQFYTLKENLKWLCCSQYCSQNKASLKRDPVNWKSMHFCNDLKVISGSVPLSWSSNFVVLPSYLPALNIYFYPFWHKNLHTEPKKKSELKINCTERTVKLVLYLRRNTLKMDIYLRGEAGPQSQL